MFVLKTRAFCVELWKHKGLLKRGGVGRGREYWSMEGAGVGCHFGE